MKIIATILRKTFLLFLPALFCFFSASAQVKFSALSSSREVGREDYIQIEFVVENAASIDRMNTPSFPDFRIIQGPIQTSGMSIVNGAMSQYKGLSFVLQPLKTGHFTIPGATAIVNGKAMQSNTIHITVSNTASTSPTTGVPFPVRGWPSEGNEVDKEYLLRKGENIDDKIRKNLFVKVQVSKTSCYAGEPIMATYKLYSKLQSESRVTRQPSLNGFSVYDMTDPTSDVAYIEKVDGKSFTVHIIRKTQLIPLQAGTIQLDPVEVENTVHFLKNARLQNHHNSLQNIFDPFGDDDVEGVPVDKEVTLVSPPVTITVKPLPEDKKPENFNGAVGRFSIDARLENNAVAAEDASSLLVTVKGTGNLPVVNAPGVQWPGGFDNYDAKEKETVDKTVFPLAGSKTFQYQFIPKEKGNYQIASIPFSFFDPSTGTYKTIQTAPLKVAVGAAAVHKALNPTILTASESSSGSLKEYFQAHLEIFFALIIFGALAIYLYRLTRKNEKTEKKRIQQEPVVAQPVVVAPPPDPLQRARRLLDMENYKGFYTELNRAVWEEVGDKMQLPGSAMNKHDAIYKLKEKGYDDFTTLLFADILYECEMNLYTPVFDTRDMQDILRRSEDFLRRLSMV